MHTVDNSKINEILSEYTLENGIFAAVYIYEKDNGLFKITDIDHDLFPVESIPDESGNLPFNNGHLMPSFFEPRLTEDEAPGPTPDSYVYSKGATITVEGVEYPIDCEEAFCIYNLFEREAVGLFIIHHSVDGQRNQNKPNYFNTAAELSRLFTDSFPYSTPHLLSVISQNPESVINFSTDMAALCAEQIEFRHSNMPNDLSDAELASYNETTSLLINIASSFDTVSSVLNEDQLSTELALENDKKAQRILELIRNDISEWLNKNRKETVDVIMRTPAISAIVYGLSFVGLPPTASMIAALAMYAPQAARSHMTELIKAMKS